MSIDKSAPRHKAKPQSRGHGETAKVKVLASPSTWPQHQLRPTQRTCSTSDLNYLNRTTRICIRGPLNSSGRQTTHKVDCPMWISEWGIQE